MLFTQDLDELETPWYRPFGGTLHVKSRISRRPSPLNDASVDVSGGMLVVQATVLSLAAKSRVQRTVLDVAKLTRVAVEAVGKDRRPVAGASRLRQNDVSRGRNAGSLPRRIHSGGLGVTMLGASAERSRLLSDVFDDCSCVGCRLSPRDRSIIREMNETAFAEHFLETGGIGCSESWEKWGAPSCPQDWHHLYFTVSTLLSLTSDLQVLLSLARQLFGDCSRVVPSGVIR